MDDFEVGSGYDGGGYDWGVDSTNLGSPIAGEGYTYDSFGNVVPVGSPAASNADPSGLAQTQVDLNSAGSSSSNFSLASLQKLLTQLGLSSSSASNIASPAGLLTGLAGLYALMGGNKPQVGGFQGTIPKKTATRQLIAQPAYKPYSGEAVMGKSYFTPTTYAAKGGIMEAAKGRYLRGPTDGMADKLDTSIDGTQPAKLSHGEFVIPADVVSHLGNGNSDAGADVLYKMMDKVRKARTGNKKQGKEINPEKFTPGGAAYAEGGSVKRFAEGGTTGSTVGLPTTTSSINPTYGSTQQGTLSNWAAPYVTDMLSKAQALSDTPYQAYQGPLSAGVSPIQQQAFEQIGAYNPSGAFDAASSTAAAAASGLGSLSYSPTAFKSQFAAPTAYSPTTFTNSFTAPDAYTPGTFSNAFTAPRDYAGVGGSFTDSGVAQSYMNPYMQQVLQPQLQAIQRSTDIKRSALGPSRMQSAFGSRSGLLDSQLNAEAMRQQQQATGQAYGAAFTQAQQQFNADQARKIQEAQFGAQQGMSAAQLRAQFGLSAQQALEASRQFAAQQALAGAQAKAQYGLGAQQATEASRQFGAQQDMTGAQLKAQYGLEALKAAEQSKQFGANLRLQALGQQMGAAGTQAQVAAARQQAQLQGLVQLMAAGAAQRDIEQQGITAAQKQFEMERQYPYAQLQFQQSMLGGLPIGTTATTPNTSGIGQIGLAGTQLTALYDMLSKVLKP